MEPIYEYFYEIQGYSLTMIITYVFAKPYITYRMDKSNDKIIILGRNRQRGTSQSPFRLRLKSKLNNTYLGQLNLRTHLLWENLRNKYADKILFYFYHKPNLFFLRRGLFSLSIGALLGFYFGEYSRGFRLESVYFSSPSNYSYLGDKVLMYISSSKNPKYVNHIMDWDLKNKIHAEKFDVVDCIQYGKFMGAVLQEEIAFQCYYLAHLKDHQNIKTNADLSFDTFITQSRE